MPKKLLSPLLIFISLILGVGSFSSILTGRAQALSGSEFNSARIIDDSVFFSGEVLNVGQVQNFLNSKVPVCDTNGTQPYAGTTRAAYSASKGVSTPFICLKDYQEDVPAVAADSYCAGALGAGHKSAAQIIVDVGYACSINPEALIVLLQKEQALVTDDWPWPIQYRSATGYGCPDTAACDSEFYGFFNQVYRAARQFQRYAKQPLSFNYRVGAFFIPYQANNAGCNGTNVYIENQSTAGLYNYTPYQPNRAALDNLYGLGDSCSAYGNRNFWRYFNDWFGSTSGSPLFPHPDGTLVRPANGPKVYLVRNGGANFGTSLGVLQSWGYDLSRLKIATKGDLSLMAAADSDPTTYPPLQFREGTLVRGSTSPTVYVIQNVGGVNHKRSLDSLENFTRLGYTSSDVIVVPDSELPAITDTPLTTAATTHPNGALVRESGSPTVYLLINGERHSMTSLPIFISQGYNFSQVKVATAGDNLLPISWPVAWFGEGTLLKGSGPNVYIIDLNGTSQSRRYFGSYYNFVSLGYKFSEVMQVEDSAIPTQEGSYIGQ